MVTEMSNMRKNLWITAFMFFVIGDLITTYFGMGSPFIYERNSIAAGWFNNGDYIALFLFKLFPFLFFYWVDLVLLSKLESLALPMIPAILTYEGIKITQSNMQVLQSVNIPPEYVIIAILAISVMFIQFAKNNLGYNGISEQT